MTEPTNTNELHPEPKNPEQQNVTITAEQKAQLDATLADLKQAERQPVQEQELQQLTPEQEEEMEARHAELSADVIALGSIPYGLVVEVRLEDGTAIRFPYSGWELYKATEGKMEKPESKLSVHVPAVDKEHPARAVYLTRNRMYAVLNQTLFSAQEHFGTMVNRMIPPGVSQAGMLGIAVVAVYDNASEPNGDGVLMHAQTAAKPMLIHQGPKPLELMLERLKEIETRLRGQLAEIYGTQIADKDSLIIMPKRR